MSVKGNTVRLSGMEERRQGSRRERWVTVSDEEGNRHFELSCIGRSKLVDRTLGEAELDVRIRPKLSQAYLQKELQQAWPSAQQDLATVAMDPLAKPKATKTREPSAGNSVFIRLARTKGKGTVFALALRHLVLPRGFNLFVLMPPACSVYALTIPSSGDADLFLSLNSAFVPPIAASVRGGTAVDAVSFGSFLCFPPFVPVVRANGFTLTLFDLYVWSFGLP